MQTIYLDISNKGVVPTVYAKQKEVGRKFAVILTDSGLPYIPVSGSAFSVWYKGASGEGNYTDIGDKSAFSLNGNKVEIEMIVQMLSAHGDGILCLTLNSPDGNQISSWNIPYMCEIVPGSESEKAEEYYTAFSKAVEKLPYPDASLSVHGKAADAAAVGTALSEKAPAGYGYGDPITITISNSQTGDELDFDTALEAVFSQLQNYSCRQVQFIDFSSGVGDVFTGTLYKNWADYGWLKGTSYSGYTMQKVKRNGAWHNREWLNPPMALGVEYRTTERFDGKAVYTRLVNCGIVAHNASITIPGVTRCVRYIGYISHPHESDPIKPLPAWSGDTIGAGYHAEVTQPINPYADGQFIIKTDSNADSIGDGGYTWFVQAWYTKD